MRPLLVAGCVLLAACSKKSDGAPDGVGSAAASTLPSSAKFAHPCDILRRADAEAILGSSDLQDQEEPGPPGDARCIWAVRGARGFVELRVHFPSRKDTFNQPAPDREPVPGIGDKAFVQKRLSWGHVDVLKGDQTFFVQIKPGDTPGEGSPGLDHVRAQTIALARTLAPRI
ncbi:MAG TPA: hypothetical protein VHS09_07640 [Polyangiaceae bacterium]|jgi:hypothetical protein|nr:hypothetical protein [Polyangiaceae bacterium]